MSRSGYIDDMDDPLAHGRWRAAVKSAARGKRGQALLRELLESLDAMPDKRLYSGSFATADGEYCTLGVLGEKRGIRTDDLGDQDDCDPDAVASRFGIAGALAAEIMYLNDEWIEEAKSVSREICGPLRYYESRIQWAKIPNERHAEERWQYMRDWVAEQIIPA